MPSNQVLDFTITKHFLVIPHHQACFPEIQPLDLPSLNHFLQSPPFYGLNCAPPTLPQKIECWSPHTQDLRVWSYLTSEPVKLLWLFATPWAVAYQASMEFSRQEYWSGLPFPSPGNPLNPGIEPRSPTLQADTLLSEPPGKPRSYLKWDFFMGHQVEWDPLGGLQSRMTGVLIRRETLGWYAQGEDDVKMPKKAGGKQN